MLYSGRATGVQWMKARNATKHPAMHRTAPHPKDTTQNINRAEVEKPHLGGRHCYNVYLTDEATEAQRGEVSFLESHSRSVTKPGFK
jgi:hypothetical protein